MLSWPLLPRRNSFLEPLGKIMNIKLELSVEDINLIFAALGELPTKTGAYALIMKVKTQADPQVPPEAHPAAPSAQE